MSRIGNLPIAIPSGVTVTVSNNEVTVTGPKGELKQIVNPLISVEIEDGHVLVKRSNEDKETRSKHGLYRSLINNMIIGVHEGYKKTLELVGVGFRASAVGQVLELGLGYSHNIHLGLAPEIKVSTVSERNQHPLIMLESCDKQLIGQVCAKIRSFRRPEPYKGKGVRFQGELVRRKAGKTAGK